MAENRLRKYALTAGTTIAVSGIGSAHAGIVSSTGPVIVELNDPREVLFTFQEVEVFATNRTSANSNLSSRVAGLNWYPVGGAGRLDFLNFNNNVAAGTTIDSSWVQSTGGSAVLLQKHFSSSTRTKASGLTPGTNQLIAFGIDTDSDRYFGWIDYSFDASGTVSDPFSLTINAWAYNDVAGQGIIAGQSTAASDGGGAAVPGLGGLAGLAIGAAGVRTRRQRIA